MMLKHVQNAKNENYILSLFKIATKKLGLESYCKQYELKDPIEYFKIQLGNAFSKAIKYGNFSCL